MVRRPTAVLFALTIAAVGGGLASAEPAHAEPGAPAPPIRSLLVPAAELGEGWVRSIESVVEVTAADADEKSYTGRMASQVRSQLAEAGGLGRADVSYEGPVVLDFCTLRLTWYRSREAARAAFEAERQAQSTMDAPVEAVPGLGEASSRPRASGDTIWLRGPAFVRVSAPSERAPCEALARAVDLRIRSAEAADAAEGAEGAEPADADEIGTVPADASP
jgi:hypothetical protein